MSSVSMHIQTIVLSRFSFFLLHLKIHVNEYNYSSESTYFVFHCKLTICFSVTPTAPQTAAKKKKKSLYSILLKYY